MVKKLVIAHKIYTMDNPNEYFTSMIIENNIIVNLSNKSKNEHNEEFDEVIEHDGIIIPGFNDSHIHVMGYGKFLEYVDLVGCNKEEMIKKVKQRINVTPPGTWVFGRGWDHENFENSEFPTIKDLDEFSKDHPVLLHRICGHIVLVNSSALAIAEINESTSDPEGGIIGRLKNNKPSGILKETAIDLVSELIPKPSLETKMRRLILAIEQLNEYGITTAHANDGNIYDLYKKLGGDLTVRTYLTPFIDDLDDLIQIGAKTNMGDHLLKWGRIKIYSDGSLGGETAAMKEPYIGTSNKGVLIYSKQKLYDLILKAHSNGWQLETHAIGDYAAEVVINAYIKADVVGNRPVLTHCQILNQELIDLMAKHKIIANIQPVFINTDLHWAEKKIGSDRMKFSYAWKSLLDHDIACAGGSDAPVENPNPILGIHAAVNRQDNRGNPKEGWYSNEKLSIYQAVKLFTVDSAYAEFQESKKGKLTPGMLADFIVLDHDIFMISKEKIKEIKVKETYLGGKNVFSSETNNTIGVV